MHSCQYRFAPHFGLASKMKSFDCFGILVKLFGITFWGNIRNTKKNMYKNWKKNKKSCKLSFGLTCAFSAEIQDFGQNGPKFKTRSFMWNFVSVTWPKEKISAISAENYTNLITMVGWDWRWGGVLVTVMGFEWWQGLPIGDGDGMAGVNECRLLNPGWIDLLLWYQGGPLVCLGITNVSYVKRIISFLSKSPFSWVNEYVQQFKIGLFSRRFSQISQDPWS